MAPVLIVDMQTLYLITGVTVLATAATVMFLRPLHNPSAPVLGLHALLVRAGLHVSHVPGLATLVVLFLILVLVRTRREEKRVLQGLRDLSKAQDCALLGLASIAETRDPETGRHILRTQHFVRALADCLGRLPRFRSQLTPEDIEAMTKSAPLHDVGKVGIPDHILLKSGQLTEEEYAIMKRHTTIGHDALKRAEEMAGVPTGVSFLRYARQVSANHHERWDGQGYPNGLSREDIPLSARLMALADVYDAIRSRRVYKPPLSHEQARAFICAGKGTQFDPDVVDAFLACEKTFQEITERYADPPEEASDAAPPDAPCTDYLGRP
jgi:response regulator RpfG family c-di-GMP phosphodiesterase